MKIDKNLKQQLCCFIFILIVIVCACAFLLQARIIKNKCGGGIVVNMTTESDDYIILASNTKSFGDANTISQFRTKLARRKEYSSEDDWRVALTEISYKQSWYNVKKDTTIFYVNDRGETEHFPELSAEDLLIPAGHYPTVLDLIGMINKKLHRLFASAKTLPEMYYDPNPQIATLIPGTRFEKDSNSSLIKFIPVFGAEIENMLGFIDKSGNRLVDKMRAYGKSQNPNLIKPVEDSPENRNLTRMVFSNNYTQNIPDNIENIKSKIDKMEINGYFPVDMNAGFNNLFIYSNIVEESDIGDAFSPILTSLPNKSSKDGWGGTIHHEPKNLVYRRLQARTFDTIEIDIRDDSGAPVAFKLGNVVVKLHFLKYGN